MALLFFFSKQRFLLLYFMCQFFFHRLFVPKKKKKDLQRPAGVCVCSRYTRVALAERIALFSKLPDE